MFTLISKRSSCLDTLLVLLLWLFEFFVLLGWLFLLFLVLLVLLALFFFVTLLLSCLNSLLLSIWFSDLSNLDLVTVEEAISFQFSNNISHSLFILTGLDTWGEELKTLLNLALERVSELGGWGFTEAIDTGCDGALVSKVTWNLTLVLKASSSNEGWVEDETVLWCLTFGLQGSEEGFLGTEDLDGRSWVFWKVCETACMCNELGADNFSNKWLEIWCNSIHTVLKVIIEWLAELNKFNYTLSPFANLEGVSFIHIHAHRDFSGFDNLNCLFFV